MAVAGNAGLAQTDQPSVEVVPAQNRGLTCLTCGIWTFESREKQATHFASDWHRANAARRVQGKPALSSTAICTAETATPKTREAEAPSSSIQVVHDDDDDDEGSEGSEEEVDDDVEGADAAIALHREERSSTVQLLLGDNLACSLSPAVLFARKFWGGRGGQALTQAVAVQAIQELCNARRLRPFRVAVVALRSGKFVAAIFEGRRMTHHKTMARYTTRRGQGGAQSTIDGSGKAPKSIGSQLRRHGERQLADDVRVLLDEWRTALNACDLITVACARVLRPVLFDSAVKSPLDPHDRRIQRLPFALHKPTLESVRQAHDRLGLFVLHEPTTRTTPRELKDKPAPQSLPEKADYGKPQGVLSIAEVVPENSESSSSLLKACEANSIQDAMALLDAAPDDLDLEARDMLGRRALHLAAQAANPHLVARLLEAGADPAALDDRDRPPYFFASDKKTRDAFRVARAQLGEAAHNWTAAAVPDALDTAALAAKKAKEQDKKKRHRERQKQAKIRAAEQATVRADAEAARVAAKTARANLDAKLIACDQCQQPIRATPFTRLEYQYCSSSCAAAHRRAQCAQAAERRMQAHANAA